MEKQIIKRDYYLTYALTNGEKVYGITKDYWRSDWSNEKALYWSEVLVDGNCFHIHKLGTLLVGKTNDELKELLEQSKINLN